MPTEITETTLRVSFSYGIKVNRGNFQSENANVSFSVEEPLTPLATNEDIVRRASDLESLLEGGVKLATFTSLNLAFSEKDGVLSPVLDVSAIPVAAAAPAQQRGGYSGGQNQAPSKISTAPKVSADLGKGLIEYYDARPLKEAGEYKPNAADFRSVSKQGDGTFDSVWLYQKDGTPNTTEINLATAAGLISPV